MAEKILEFNIDAEVVRFDALEIEVNDTLIMINEIIALFSKADIAKGATGKLVLLIEQKISLLTRKESIIKAMADMKKNRYNANAKVQSGEDGDTDLAKVMIEYTDAIKKQHKTMEEAKEIAGELIAKNGPEVDNYFKEVKT